MMPAPGLTSKTESRRAEQSVSSSYLFLLTLGWLCPDMLTGRLFQTGLKSERTPTASPATYYMAREPPPSTPPPVELKNLKGENQIYTVHT